MKTFSGKAISKIGIGSYGIGGGGHRDMGTSSLLNLLETGEDKYRVL